MAKLTKKDIKKLQGDLKHERVLIWDELAAKEEKSIFSLAEDYKMFLNYCRTERLATKWIMEIAAKAGFAAVGTKSDRIALSHKGKVVGLGWLGKKPLSEGIRIIGSHIDCPRLDMKSRPVFENEQVAFLKTQYYGGIRKYQWLARPLALIGPIVKSDGSVVEIEIGTKPDDPVFTIADLLPHLARKAQGDKKITDAFVGEKLNIIMGTRPLGDSEVKDRFKLNVLKLLNEQYGITEADFISADLEAVPADSARDVGLDRSLIGGYGHDDRVCAYTSLMAGLDLIKSGKMPERPGLLLFMDKEETGSDGNTGAKSRFMEYFVGKMIEASGQAPSAWAIQEALYHSTCLSADVTGVLDPDYPEVHEKRNATFFAQGPAMVKYTGSGGKYSTNDAHAEFIGWLRGVLDAAKVHWQASVDKVDEGGGGTIAKFMAAHGMDVVDIGVPVLGMHSPFELISKADLYMTQKAFAAFLAAK